MGIERVYISSVWAEGFGYRQVLHTKKALHVEQAHRRDLQGYLSSAAVLWQKKNIHHSASADGRRENLGSGGRFYFSPSLFHFFPNPKLLPWEKLSLTSMLQNETRWQTLKQMQAFIAASHINVCVKQRERMPEKLRELSFLNIYVFFFHNSKTCTILSSATRSPAASL